MYSASRNPQAISHRGLRTHSPENSLPAFRQALAAGAEGIELDVHASVDGKLFVHHDADVATGANGTEVTRSRIRELDANLISSLRLDGDVPIPALDDVLAEVRNAASIYIEIKAPGIEAEVARCLRRHASIVGTCAVHSFDHRVSKRMAALMPSLRTGILQVSYPVDSCALLRAAGALDLWQHLDFIDIALVVNVRAFGGRVIAWTPNAARDWERLAAIGVHGICTDRVGDYVHWRDASSAAT